jgi:hypothetical protein
MAGMRMSELRHGRQRTYTGARRQRALSLLARRRSLLHGLGPVQYFGPALPSSGALLFGAIAACAVITERSNSLTIPALSAWLAYTSTHCGNGLGAAYTVLSMRRRTEPSSLGPADNRHGSNRILLPRLGPMANGVSSSLVRLPHFHKAPSSDGASFFPKRFDVPDCEERHPCK